MRHFRGMAFVILVPTVVVAAVYSSSMGTTRVPSRAGGQLATIPQPTGWTAFDAEYVSSEPNAPDLVGHYYRSADGSWRQEGHTKDRSLQMITICSIELKRAYYHSTREATWFSQPLSIPNDGFKPPRPRRVGMRGMTRLTRLYEGLEVYEYRDPVGSVNIQAPALNFFSLESQTPTGRRLRFTNVLIRPQDSALFQPPTGVAFQNIERSLPMGVRMDPEQLARRIQQP